MKLLSYKEMVKDAMYYIEMYANPVKMAMTDLESGKLKDPFIINLISDLVANENSHKKEVRF